MKEQTFDPPTQAPNKEGLAHPMAEAQGIPQARLVNEHTLTIVRHPAWK